MGRRQFCRSVVLPIGPNIEYEIDEAAGNYGRACERLREIKGRYDPTNLFRLNSNVKPAA